MPGLGPPGMPAQTQIGAYNPMQFNPTMTPEQHYAMQQNWQQWQTYQQQYAQWQATYGEKVNQIIRFDRIVLCKHFRSFWHILVSTGDATKIQSKCTSYASSYDASYWSS